VPSAASPSSTGDVGREAGADFAGSADLLEGGRGSAVPHSSQSRSARWFRKVQAGQAVPSVSFVEGLVFSLVFSVSDASDELARPEEGRELDMCDLTGDICPAIGFSAGTGVADASSTGIDERETPHSPHILAACGLRPGGFRYAHTSHSHAAHPGVVPSVWSFITPAEETDVWALAGRDRWRVALGELANKPA
jgi:hypothetical protein